MRLCVAAFIALASMSSQAWAFGPGGRDAIRVVVAIGADEEKAAPMAALVDHTVRQLPEKIAGMEPSQLEKLLEVPEPVAIAERRSAADQALRQGKAAYEAMDLRAAADRLASARELLMSQGPYMDPRQWVHVHAMLARTAAFEGAPERTAAHVQAMIRWVGGEPWPGASADPALGSFVAKALRAQPNTPRGGVTIKGNMPGAEVRVDGKHRGYAPADIELEVGLHLVEMRMMGCQIWAHWVNVIPAQSVVVEGRLLPTPHRQRWDAMVHHASGESSRSEIGQGVQTVLDFTRAEWAVVGRVKIGGKLGWKAELAVFDRGYNRRLLRRTISIPSIYTGAADVVTREVDTLLREALKRRRGADRERDPLDSLTGMEEWAAPPSADAAPPPSAAAPAAPPQLPSGRAAPPPQLPGTNVGRGTKTRSDDPLDDRDGTEDW